jgi:glycosyltransferase involved in cell wall biosynthesis
MRERIAFVVHMLAPYRVSFFQKLFSCTAFEWKLFAGKKQVKKDARPQYEGRVDFEVSFHNECIRNRLVYHDILYQGMYDAVTRYDPDVIILFAHVGTSSFRKIVSWARAHRKKVVMWTCFWEPDYITGYKRIIRNLLIRNFYTRADHHIAYSSLAKQKLLKLGYPDKQISIAYNGIDLDQYERGDHEDMLPQEIFDHSSVNFLYVGGFGKDKKVDLLIKAIGECKAFSSRTINAYLIGDGPLYSEYVRLVHSLGLDNHIKFLGRINTHLDAYIKSADCIVLPGTGGLILNEAMLFQKPVVVSEADGTENDLLLNGYNGIKFQTNSKASLASAMYEIAENLSFFQENAKKASEVVIKRSNVDSMIAIFLRTLNKLTAHGYQPVVQPVLLNSAEMIKI